MKFLTTLPDPRDRSYGEALRAALKKLFEVFHQREQHSKAEFPCRRLKEGARHGSTVGPVRPANAAQPEYGEAVPQARRSVLYLRDHPGGGTDEQPGRASDSLRGD